MRIADVMTRRVRSLKQWETIDVADAVLRFWAFRHVPIVDAEGRVVGMITRTDLLQAAASRGKQRLLLTVSQVMRRPVVTAREDESLEVAAERMLDARIHALPVIDDGERLVGIVTDRDLLAALAGGAPARGNLDRVPVDLVMTRSPVTIAPEATLSDAAEALLREGFRHLPVVDEGRRLVGMLSERDLRARLGMDVAGFPRATLEALSQPVSDAMTPDPVSVRSGTSLTEALETFVVERVGALPVVGEADELLGILSYIDVVMWLQKNAVNPRGGTAPGDATDPVPGAKEGAMLVKDIMTRRAETVAPDETLQVAAERMRSLNVGALPVSESDRLVGMITDRDITVRAAAKGLDPARTLVREAMTPQVIACSEDQSVFEAARLMRDMAVRRVMVLDRGQRLVGILSLDDLVAEAREEHLAADVIESAATLRARD